MAGHIHPQDSSMLSGEATEPEDEEAFCRLDHTEKEFLENAVDLQKCQKQLELFQTFCDKAAEM